MMVQPWHIKTLASACKGRIIGDDSMSVSAVAIDSRRVTVGDMFIALRTDTNDGHKYVQQAVDNGAVCVLVHHAYTGIGVPQIVVSDTFQALTDMGAYARSQFKGTVIGVTGSVGKTSVKDSLTAVLKKHAKTHATVGNLNNHLGVPLSLLALPQDCTYAVIEMGMSARGEMRHLTQIVRPHVAIVTAVDVAHLESFADVSGIAWAKSEIFEGLVGDKIAIYNGDSLHAEILQQVAEKYADNIYTYTCDNICTYGVDTRGRQQATVCMDNTTYDITLPALGVHRILNAVGVLRVVQALGLSIVDALDTLKCHMPSAGRGRMHVYQVCQNKGRHIQIQVFDETYNSSPASLRASIQVLHDTPTQNRRVLVMGDMLELGGESANLHKRIYDKTLFNNMHMVFLCGENMHHLYGCIMHKKQVFWNKNVHALSKIVLQHLQDKDVVLVKGSRGMQMDVLLQQMQRIQD